MPLETRGGKRNTGNTSITLETTYEDLDYEEPPFVLTYLPNPGLIPGFIAEQAALL